MSDNESASAPQNDNTAAQTGENAQPRFSMRGQYIKDVSLENPHAPASLMAGKEPPKVDLNIDLQGQKIQENMFELSMVFNIKASTEKTLFMVDLTYAGIFELANIPEELLERVLLVDAAFTLFPYARRVVSDMTRDAGFPPLMLEPMDFLGLYEQRTAQAQKEQAGAVN